MSNDKTFTNTFKGQTQPGMHELEGMFQLPGAADHPDLAHFEPSTPADLMFPITDPTKSSEEVAAIQDMMNQVIGDAIREAARQSGRSFESTGWKVEERTIPGSTFEEDAPEVAIKMATPPAEGECRRPLIISLHGGAHIVGDADMDSAMLFTLIENDGIGERPVLVQPNYRLAPNHPYPAGIEDCYATVVWALDHADTLGIDLERVVLLGSSTGATMTAGLAFLLRDRGIDAIAAQVLLFPPLSDMPRTRSDLLELETWSALQSRKAWQAYLGDNYGRADLPPYAAPSRALDHRGLPPTILHVAELDRDRDEALAFAMKLIKANVFAELHHWAGVFHSFPFLGGESEIASRFYHDLSRSLKVALTGKLPRRQGQVR